MKNDHITVQTTIRNIKKGIINGDITNHSEIELIIKKCVKALQESQVELSDMLDKHNSCEHTEWNHPTYTNRKRLLGWFKVYERKCKNCGHIEVFKIDVSNHEKNKEQIPTWAEDAKEQFYNNSI